MFKRLKDLCRRVIEYGDRIGCRMVYGTENPDELSVEEQNRRFRSYMGMKSLLDSIAGPE